MGERDSTAQVLRRAIGLCTKCGKQGPLFFFPQESHQLCETCTVHLWLNTTGTPAESRSQEAAVLRKLKLKDHPALNRYDLSTWPPVWVNARQPNKQLIGASGVLTRLMFNERTPDRLFLQIEFEGARYMGCLMARDSSLCQQLHIFLKNHIGKTVKEVGDLDVSFML